MKMRKSALARWIDTRLAQDPALRTRVEETLREMRIEQDLVALRAERGLSQRDLARLLGISQPAIAKIESGKVKNVQLRTLARMAAALGGQLKVEIVRDGRPRRAAVR
jgi:DNA-binding Xre family transcriptional regulator